MVMCFSIEALNSYRGTSLRTGTRSSFARISKNARIIQPAAKAVDTGGLKQIWLVNVLYMFHRFCIRYIHLPLLLSVLHCDHAFVSASFSYKV